MGNRQVVEQFAKALGAHDLDAQHAVLHDEYVGRYPQSGEVIRGAANRRAILENYPGGADRLRAFPDRIVGRDDEFVAGPSWNIIHLVGSGDEFTLTGTAEYPNGETWQLVMLLTLREGKIWREVAYFAAPFDAPDWRRPFVELETAADGN